ncbi:response regulator [Planctobacterium marinum]|uniref:histidine kinase n=1 Tax=Planctobacterium marinum TaxID=1631968 RepID=A0AA48HJ61_9ALTE|nr:hypothetical protein MACH26_00880 [Planctobacterium marinum]
MARLNISPEKPRILIIDDEKSNLKILTDLLSTDADVSVAKSAEQGLWKAKKFQPDLILLDIIMPDVDGFETLKRLKNEPDLNEVSVIFITGLDTADNEKYGLDLGALDYIRKPFNAAVVKSRIATHLKLIQQTKELRKLSVKLREADEAKSRFLANMSHEIRTPLTSIIGYAELLKKNEISGMASEQAVDIIATSGNHLLNLINDILDISKIEAEKLELESVSCLLPVLLEEVFALIKPKIELKKLGFDLELQFPIPSHIITDPTRLKQVLINLLNNAIKFTEKGSVKLIVCASNELMKFNVVDTGVGISKEQQARIFSAFEQADVSVTRQFGGTGLGLNISKYLTTRLGGDLSVSSVPGVGSDFEASITLCPGDEAQSINNETDYAKVIHSQKVRQATNVQLSGKILLAEDQKELRMLLTMMLSKLGLDVTAVENGLQLVQQAQLQDYDLVLSDIHMPEMGGEEAIALLLDAGINVPTIALTANAMKHEVENYLNKGFTDHLSKPIQRNEFIRKLALYLGKDDDVKVDSEFQDDMKVRFVEQFKNSLPSRLEVLENAFFAQDWRAMTLLAHSLKGSSLSFSLHQISELSMDIEALATAAEVNNSRANELADVLLKLKSVIEEL